MIEDAPLRARAKANAQKRHARAYEKIGLSNLSQRESSAAYNKADDEYAAAVGAPTQAEIDAAPWRG